ncbi:uncharacterized protein LOC131238696 [Magnolia sinica]|uniref:uncharacterized protein LOC131238696 n=1 Tax=Magnolia sinica TaxID=86752 RepID=UPI002658C4AA|nr:uncharacterized protein LOC131238696 [Magnolia sinica]
MLKGEKEQECDGFEFDNDGLACKDPFTILLTRANSSKTCFYSNLNLKNLRNFYHRKRDCPHTAKEDCMGHNKAESANVSSKVLPICDAALAGGSTGPDCSSDASMNRKRRAISRMKELLRWAAVAKSDKGGIKRWKVLHFRNRSALKDSFDETSSGSSKISFTWDVGSCSTASALSPLSLPSSSASRRTSTTQHLECISEEMWVGPKTEECTRIGNWITTDSEFVVLEL